VQAEHSSIDPPARRRFDRGSDEFTRVLAFSDALFAIAMTLLVVGIRIPSLAHGGDESELLDKLGDLIPEFASFFISFAVIGRYWLAHHQFYSRLRTLDSGIIALNLLYLAFIAFLPFPTGLLGGYFENAVSIALYAPTVACVSFMEVVLFRHAHRDGLLESPVPEDVFRWGSVMSLSPVLFFLLSIPLAFISTVLAVACWFLAIPFQIVAQRWRPPGADTQLLG
jgi:uncharacterized membrane protein